MLKKKGACLSSKHESLPLFSWSLCNTIFICSSLLIAKDERANFRKQICHGRHTISRYAFLKPWNNCRGCEYAHEYIAQTLTPYFWWIGQWSDAPSDSLRCRPFALTNDQALYCQSGLLVRSLCQCNAPMMITFKLYLQDWNIWKEALIAGMFCQDCTIVVFCFFFKEPRTTHAI